MIGDFPVTLKILKGDEDGEGYKDVFVSGFDNRNTHASFVIYGKNYLVGSKYELSNFNQSMTLYFLKFL